MDKLKNTSYKQVTEERVKYETYMAQVFGTTAHGRMMLEWRDSHVGSAAVEFVPCPVVTYNTMVNTFSGPKTAEFPFEDSEGKEKKLHGRNCGHATLKKLKQAVTEIHALCGHYEASPTLDLEVVKRYNNLPKADPHGAGSVDMVDFLEHMHHACFNTGNLTPLRRVRDWLLVLLSLNFFWRPSEGCQYCPLVETLQLPPLECDFGRDGLPERIKLTMFNWKGRVHSSDWDMYLHRNRLDIRFCPVFWLLTWLRLSDIRSGPILCELDESEEHILRGTQTATMSCSKGSDYTVYMDEGSRMVNLSYAKYCAISKRMFVAAGYPTLTAYTFRKTGCKWGARCGAADWMLKNTGRWTKTSQHFYCYIEEGLGDRRLATMGGRWDRIRSMWVYKPTTFHTEIAPELDR